ncbi:probable ADP-ribosylation factor GTPase-activating protein AGD13 [Physcomitrium patens]|uniref:Uncharacterized protein n=1 Tax=Physcomitrium patens TaxID=3218 RepID=A0A2K1IM57_PHYPA|nr:probable ADP-ribosylation factor GTPase-activating protein AGD13 [Physcomitrium patens]XP_024361233.1 probable ADP-ribosylation factor GTPase-activating protein AGD13 [Physcomitrium patens]XP_024361234.1 probable ADP-ribosylation factor GTPase-activating protein AGD13 [Physcomitrium patens]PNR30360.1 hypothetical protein PHYPA_026676 [Physcomitrium patens]|eukprot:XP_024361232.1 probable ADP-ribosylation factor GTPase-activating protein AGD13 [Physcomitrella patens]
MDKLKKLLQQPDNRLCADCRAPYPKWASTSIGVFICTKCYEVHRDLGAHISTVVSVNLEEWSDEQVEVMEAVGGNAAANSVYEKCIPSDVRKPSPNASIDERTDFIRRKYEDQEFLKPNLRMKATSRTRSSSSTEPTSLNPSALSNRDSVNNNRDSVTSNSRSSRLNQGETPPGSFNNYSNSSSLASSGRSGGVSSRSSSSSSARKEESLGMLKVTIIRGRSLVVRDLLSSDPYVSVSYGTQTFKTGVVNRNLNPVWKEEFYFSVGNPPQPVKLEVFDHDVFSADDSMGTAEVDLNPLILAAQMHQGMFEAFGSEKIGRWLATSDNSLIEDSNIEVIDGVIKQDIIFKLKNVERGELELSLEWVPIHAP